LWGKGIRTLLKSGKLTEQGNQEIRRKSIREDVEGERGIEM
jgi:hypothetical protein